MLIVMYEGYRHPAHHDWENVYLNPRHGDRCPVLFGDGHVAGRNDAETRGETTGSWVTGVNYGYDSWGVWNVQSCNP